MRLKDLFTVPEGQKITEKQFRRVLISSICSVLLCMTCLVSTTWAWFAVTIENTGNLIWIGEPKLDLTVGGTKYEAGTELSAAEITLNMANTSQADDFDKKSTLYVTLTVHSENGAATLYTTLNKDNNYASEVSIKNNTGKPFSIGWTVSWFAPANAAALTGDVITLEVAQATESSASETTQATTAEATRETTAPTAPTS